jgi:LemA protein
MSSMLLAELSTGTVLIIVIAGGMLLLLLIIAWLAYTTYNGLVVAQERYKNQWAQIDVQLRRRHDLIGPLVETVKGYMAHERETLEEVISARNQCTINLEGVDLANAATMQNLMGAENMLTGALSKLMAVSEDYPDLKANQTMANLQEELTSTENRIAYSRQAYNDSSTGFNIFRKKFPQLLFASMFGYTEDAPLWEIEDDSVRDAPEVKFS